MKILLFGKIGSGKSFVGEWLQREFGIPYHDADEDLPASITEAIRNHQPVTEEMRDQFAGRIMDRIHQLSRQHEDFCVAQALFKDRHRLQLLEQFPDLRLVWVRSPESLLDSRLQERTGHIATQYYARMVNPHFEPPSSPHGVLDNSTDLEALRAQIVALLASFQSRPVYESAPSAK